MKTTSFANDWVSIPFFFSLTNEEYVSTAAVDKCKNDTCSGGKVCLNRIGTTECVCPTGFYGQNCSQGELKWDYAY